MGQIFFDSYIKLKNFNLNNKNEINIPTDSNATKDSIVYSVASSDFYDEKNKLLFAVYKPTNFASDKFVIYRNSIDDDYMTYLGTVENVTDGVVDYGVASNKRYRYTVQTNPQDNNNISIQTNYLNVHWNKWSIVSLNYDVENDIYYPDNTVFTFENNLNAGSISDNMNFIKYNTLDKFGKIMQTPQRYESGSLTCLFGNFKSFCDIRGNYSVIFDNSILDNSNNEDMNNKIQIYLDSKYSSSEYENCYIYLTEYNKYYKKNLLWEPVKEQYIYYDDEEKMVLWKQFLQDQKVKLLKSPKGDMWVVSISDQTSREIQYNSISYPTTISFNWQEVIDKDKISIMSW